MRWRGERIRSGSSRVEEVNGCKEKDKADVVEVEFAEVDVDAEEIGGTRGVGCVGVGVADESLTGHEACRPAETDFGRLLKCPSVSG